MKKNRIVVIALAVLMVFAAVSCKDEPVHEHVYAQEWKSDATSHWHECECGEKSDVAEHEFEVVKDSEELVKKCTVCGYKAEEKIEDAVIVGTPEALKTAVEGTSKTIYLEKDIELTSYIVIKRDIEINLNGKNIKAIKNFAIFAAGGDSKISGKGVVTVSEDTTDTFSVIYVSKASLNIGRDVVVSSDCCYGITAVSDSVLTIAGTVQTKGVPAVSGNGSSGLGGTKITVNGTVSAKEENAIYHPQKGELVINGVVEGNGGIEMKAGVLTLSDSCVITATAETQEHVPNGDGCSTSGYAIALVNNKAYDGPATMGEKKGTITGVVKTDLVD